MTNQFAITADEWTKITDAGDSVSVWLGEDSDGAMGQVDVRVVQSLDGVPADDPGICKRVYRANGNQDTVSLESANARGIWYARCKNPGDKARISVDTNVNHCYEVDVNIQSQVNPIFQYFLMRELKTDITLTAPIARDAVSMNVSAGHGFTVGSMAVVSEGEVFAQVEVTGVATNLITVAVPFDTAFTLAAKVVRGDVNMAVDGSVTPVEFFFRPPTSQTPIDICGGQLVMTHTVEGDDGKFGGITALANGVYIRRVGGISQNLGNYKTNAAFRLFGWDLSYPPKSPSGTYATECSMRTIPTFTQELRFDPRTGDYLKLVVRDNLTGLTRMVVSILGSYTKGE